MTILDLGTYITLAMALICSSICVAVGYLVSDILKTSEKVTSFF